MASGFSIEELMGPIKVPEPVATVTPIRQSEIRAARANHPAGTEYVSPFVAFNAATTCLELARSFGGEVSDDGRYWRHATATNDKSAEILPDDGRGHDRIVIYSSSLVRGDKLGHPIDPAGFYAVMRFDGDAKRCAVELERLGYGSQRHAALPVDRNGLLGDDDEDDEEEPGRGWGEASSDQDDSFDPYSTDDRPMPSVGASDDGRYMLTRGFVTGLFGPSGGGKSMLLVHLALQEIRTGKEVAYIDVESQEWEVIARFKNFGITKEERKHLHYFNPEVPYTDQADGVRAFMRWARRIEGDLSLIIVDSVGDAGNAAGKDANNDLESSLIFNTAFRPMARRLKSKPAVAYVDHVNKADEATILEGGVVDSAGASVRKRNMTDKMVMLRPVRPFAIGVDGEFQLNVRKDKAGRDPKGYLYRCEFFSAGDKHDEANLAITALGLEAGALGVPSPAPAIAQRLDQHDKDLRGMANLSALLEEVRNSSDTSLPPKFKSVRDIQRLSQLGGKSGADRLRWLNNLAEQGYVTIHEKGPKKWIEQHSVFDYRLAAMHAFIGEDLPNAEPPATFDHEIAD